jgi:signal transduction histidine kinase
MSHEIRTPLTAIIGFASLLRDRKDLPESAQLQVRRIESAGSALQAIVNDVLDFSKIEAGAVNLAPQAVSPESILRDTAALFTAQAGAKSLFLELVIEEPLPKCVRLDPNRFGQILFNLIGNAIKFTDQGGVTLVASYDQRLNTLKVLVEDTGPGLDDRDLPRLFDRFSQCDMSSTRKHGGAGLGLAISKGLVERMGGSIAAESKVGAGSTFRFEICAPTTTRIVASSQRRCLRQMMRKSSKRQTGKVVCDMRPFSRSTSSCWTTVCQILMVSKCFAALEVGPDQIKIYL